ncbi:MAG TPA: class I SAM-dependent methyltransferase [Acidobacteriota bacterium]|nr:class I SAM-dependent methyltransferase [Acidobacteriota bacterium]
MRSDELEPYYRARAPEYEQIYYRDIPDQRAELEAEAGRLQGLVTGKRVLDLACGTGYWTEVMAGSAAGITAVDISAEMLCEAAKKTYACPVRFVQGSLLDVPEDGGRYDVVTLGFWFSHQPRQEYDHLYDVITASLQPDGLAWLLDNSPPAEKSEADVVRVDEHGNSYKRRWLRDGREFVIIKNYFTRVQLEAAFSDRFDIRRLVYGRYYWSAVVGPREKGPAGSAGRPETVPDGAR